MYRKEPKPGNRVEYYLRDELIGTYYPAGDKELLELLFRYGTPEARLQMDYCQLEGSLVVEARAYNTSKNNYKTYYLDAGNKMQSKASNIFIKTNKMVVYPSFIFKNIY